MKKLFLLSIALFVAFVAPVSIDAYPHVYERWILKKDGKIVKTVDLIGDIHFFENEASGELFDDTICAIPGASERKMRQNLRRIADRKTGPIIEMFGEFSPHQRLFLQGKEAKGLAMRIKGYCLVDIGMKFNEDYNPAKQKRLIYSDADVYRWTLEIHSDAPYNTCKLSSPDSLLMKDLALLKSKVDRVLYSKIESLWTNFEKDTLNPFCTATGKAKDLFRQLHLFPMNLELIIKIFGSPYSHNIVRACLKFCSVNLDLS
jgi:hypothetical protein